MENRTSPSRRHRRNALIRSLFFCLAIITITAPAAGDALGQAPPPPHPRHLPHPPPQHPPHAPGSLPSAHPPRHPTPPLPTPRPHDLPTVTDPSQIVTDTGTDTSPIAPDSDPNTALDDPPVVTNNDESPSPSSEIVATTDERATVTAQIPAPVPSNAMIDAPAMQAAPDPSRTTSDEALRHSRDNGSRIQSIAIFAAFALLLAAWWGARRRSAHLASEAASLEKKRQRLHHANQQLRSQSEKLLERAILDPLTGTLNRQAFAHELRGLTDHLSRFNRPLHLIVFDLDHFKAINDKQGHLAGDSALKLVVGIVREHLVSADVLGRFGGDEFLIACADRSLEACRDLAESIRAAVVARATTHAPPLPGLSLSMGVAQADSSTGYLADDLFARADTALYEAKRRGRNCVVIADDSLPPVPSSTGAQRHL